MSLINLDSKAWLKSIKNWQNFSIVCGGHLTLSKISVSTKDVAFCVMFLKNEEPRAEGAFSDKITAIYNSTRFFMLGKDLEGCSSENLVPALDPTLHQALIPQNGPILGPSLDFHLFPGYLTICDEILVYSGVM